MIQASSYPNIYDGAWKNDNFLGKTDLMWYITEGLEEYQGQWSSGYRNGQGVIKKVLTYSLTYSLTHLRTYSPI